MGIFDGIFNNGPQDDAAQAQISGLNKAAAGATSAVNTGQTNTNTDYAAALQPATTNFDNANAGQTNYSDATGVNGAAGYAKALSDFQTAPGYQFQLQQGDQNILRNQSQTGQLASGGTNIDLLQYGQGLANQQWQQYITNLQPFLGQASTAASTIAGTNTAKAGTDASAASQLANIAWGQGTGTGNAIASADLAKVNENANTINFGSQAAKALTGYLPPV